MREGTDYDNGYPDGRRIFFGNKRIGEGDEDGKA